MTHNNPAAAPISSPTAAQLLAEGGETASKPSEARSVASFTPWEPANERERGVYEHYMGGSERGDLYRYVKLGKVGRGQPYRSHSNAFAAWMAGRDLAALAKARGEQA